MFKIERRGISIKQNFTFMELYDVNWNKQQGREGYTFLSHITRREDASMERFMVQGKGEDTRPRARPSMRSTTLELHKKSCSTRGMAMDR